jgi:hypothetical protein
VSVLVTPLHWLAIAALGVAAGAMLTESFVLVPYWRSLDAVDFYRWYGANAKRLWFFTAVSLTALFTAAAAGAATLWAGGKNASVWLNLTAITASLTSVFLHPNDSFRNASIPSDRLPAELARWARWQYVCTAVVLGALVVSLAALSN